MRYDFAVGVGANKEIVVVELANTQGKWVLYEDFKRVREANEACHKRCELLEAQVNRLIEDLKCEEESCQRLYEAKLELEKNLVQAIPAGEA